MRELGRLSGWVVTVSLIVLPACGGGGSGGVVATDTTPPQFAQLQVVPSMLQEGEPVRAEALVTDPESGVAQVQVRIRYPNGFSEVRRMQREAGTNRFVVQWNVPSGVSGEQNEVQIIFTASDLQGNTRDSEYAPRPRLAKQPPDPPSW